MDKEEGQAIFEMGMLENKLKQLDQQLGVLEQYIAENEKTYSMIGDFAKNQGSEIFVPLGTGLFTKANLGKADKVLMSLGAGIVAEKDIASAKKLLEKRKDKFIEAREELGNQIKMILQSITELDRNLKGHMHSGHGEHGHDRGHNHEGHDHSEHDHHH